MPKLAVPLTEVQIAKAKPKAVAYRLADGNGLYLEVSPHGRKTWLVRYRLPSGERPSPVTIGHYPDLSLAEARVATIMIHRDAKTGIKPHGVRAQQRTANEARDARERAEELARIEAQKYAFREVSARWLAGKRLSWSAATYSKADFVLNSYLLPRLADHDMRTLATKDVKPVLMEMGQAVPTLAKKARQYINGIVDYAITDGMRGDDQVLRLKGIVPTRQGGHLPAITDKIETLGQLMQAIENYDSRVTKAALKLAAFTAVRPGIIASARWDEIDLDAGEWNIPASRMKMRQEFSTSLPKQAVKVLQEMHMLTGGTEYVFPPLAMQKTPHLNRDTLSKALRDMGYQGRHTTHGFRATLRTLGRERLKIDIDVLESQLAHAPKDEVDAAYARVKFKEQRREVMQMWADQLEAWRDDKPPSKVMQLKEAA